MMDMGNMNIEDDFFFNGNLMKNLVLMREFVKNKVELDGQNYENVYAFGYNYFTAGQYKKAKDIFKMLVVAGQENLKGFIALGACLQKLKEYDNAIRVYAAGHLVDPTSAKVLFNLGLCHFAKDNFAEAEIAYLFACVTGMAAKDGDPEKICLMAERMWKTSRSKQNKEAIELEQSLIQVD